MANTTFDYDIIFVLQQLGIALPGNIKGTQFYVTCPFCAGVKKLNINLKENCWRCAKCGEGGGMLDLYVKCGAAHDRKEAHAALQAIYSGTGVTSQKAIAYRKVDVAARVEKQADVLPTRDLDVCYSHYLNVLTLTELHRMKLRERGLTDADINGNGYKSVPTLGTVTIPRRLIENGINTKGVPGFYVRDDGTPCLANYGTGFYVPIRDIDGRISCMQIRLDTGIANKDSTKPARRYIYFATTDRNQGTSMTGAENKVHFRGISREHVPSCVYLTEGPLKADVAHALCGKAFIAIAGVNNLSTLPEALMLLKELGTTTVVNAFDMDRFDNPYVMKAVSKIVQQVKELGLNCEEIRWNKSYKGIDDYLLYTKLRKEQQNV